MKSLFANISIFLLVSAHIIFQTSTSVEAQQKPVSLLPETLNTTAPNTKSKAITPSQDTDSKNEVVQIDELKDLDLESTGVLDIESGGFSKNMWNGTSHSKAILLLKNLPSILYSRGLQNLQKKLLLTRATSPLAEENENKNSILKLRQQTLFRSGKLNYFKKIQQNIPRSHDDEELAQLAVNVFFLTNNLGAACDLIKYWFDKSQTTFWQKSLIFCDAINGLRDNVDFGMKLLTETQEREDTKFVSLVNAINTNLDIPPTEQITDLLPRDVAMLRFAKQVLPKPNPGALPLWLYDIYINDPSTTQENRLTLANRAFQLGLLTAEKLAKLYETASLPQDDIATAVTLTDAGDTLIPDALLYRLVLSQETDFGKAQAIDKALSFAARNGSILEMAELYKNVIKSIVPASELGWFACSAALLNLINLDFTAARLWLEIAEREDKLNDQNSITWSKMWPLLWLLNGDNLVAWDEEKLENWEQGLANRNSPQGRSLVNLTYYVLEIFGAEISNERWNSLSGKGISVTNGYSIFTNTKSIEDAIENKRAAEATATLLLSMGGLKASELQEESLLFLISTLDNLGLEQEARNIAFQVLIQKMQGVW